MYVEGVNSDLLTDGGQSIREWHALNKSKHTMMVAWEKFSRPERKRLARLMNVPMGQLALLKARDVWGQLWRSSKDDPIYLIYRLKIVEAIKEQLKTESGVKHDP